MKRRHFLQLAGGAAAAYAIGARARAAQPQRRSPKRAILVFVTGGWDTTYALDPKTPTNADVPAGDVHTFGNLDVFADASRPSVGGFFERHGASSAIVRGVCTDAINHNECQRRIATGTREETRPDFGAIIAHDLGNDLPLPYLILGDVAFTGPYAVSSGRVGMNNQIVDLLGAARPRRDLPHAVPADDLSDHERALLRNFAQASVDRAHATRGAVGYNRRRVDDFVEAIDRGEQLRPMRTKFGHPGEVTSFDSQITLALDAIEQGISHSVLLSTRCDWDTHGGNARQNDFHEVTFAGLSRMVDELERRPGRDTGSKMIDDTVVVTFSEMSRTPYLYGDGKGHWPVTSALVTGAGVRGNRVFGATTADSVSVPIDFATGAPDVTGHKPLYANFVAGLLALCGCDPAEHLPEIPVYDAFAS